MATMDLKNASSPHNGDCSADSEGVDFVSSTPTATNTIGSGGKMESASIVTPPGATHNCNNNNEFEKRRVSFAPNLCNDQELTDLMKASQLVETNG